MSLNNMTDYLKPAIAVVLAAVIALAIVGAYQYPKTEVITSTSPQGGTTTTAHFYSVAVNLATPGANATSSSVFNSSSNDYYVSSIKGGCENIGTSKTAYTGTGLAALTLSVATSSTAAPIGNANANIVGNTTITIGTSTSQFAVSSSTLASLGTPSPSIIWGAGTYMTFTFNATNTAACTVGVEAFSS